MPLFFYPMRTIQLLCVMLCTVNVYAQVDNVKLVPSGDKFVITYDLTSSEPNQKFKITAFSGHDNYASPIQHVTGAVGENIAPGKGLRIEWDARSSLPANFNGTIAIRLRGVAMPMLKQIEQSVYKKGNSIPINWTGGSKTDKMNIELVRDGKVQKVIASGIENTSSMTWKIPGSVKAGKDYTIRLTNATDPMQPSASNSFDIKPKIPLLVKLAVPVVAGVAIWAATQGGGSDDDTLPAITVKP